MRFLIVLLMLFAPEISAENVGSRPDIKLINKIQTEAMRYRSLVFEVRTTVFETAASSAAIDLDPSNALRVCRQMKRDISRAKKLMSKVGESLRRMGHAENRLRGMRTGPAESFVRTLDSGDGGGMLRAIKKEWKKTALRYKAGFRSAEKRCKEIGSAGGG